MPVDVSRQQQTFVPPQRRTEARVRREMWALLLEEYMLNALGNRLRQQEVCVVVEVACDVVGKKNTRA